MNQRRLFVRMFGAGLASHMVLLRAQTSIGAMRRVGVLAPSTRAKEEITLKPFFDEMRQLGWAEGQNITYDRVYADDQQQTLSRLASELVARKPEVIYAPTSTATVPAKEATLAIPIVFAFVANPVSSGLVTTLARPGGNVTGVVAFSESLAGKRIELLRGIFPTAKHLAFLHDANDPAIKFVQQALVPVATAWRLTLSYAGASNPVEFEAAVGSMVADRVDAIFPEGAGSIAFNMRGRLIELANQKRLPVIGASAPWADAGALFSYGATFAGRLRRSAQLVDKILKGAKPADIPVEQSTVFELVVNLKTAKALGIKVPQSILLRADRVIE